MLWTLSLFEKYKTNIDDLREKRRYSHNILQWFKNGFESMIYINVRTQDYHQSLTQPYATKLYLRFSDRHYLFLKNLNVSAVNTAHLCSLGCSGFGQGVCETKRRAIKNIHK